MDALLSWPYKDKHQWTNILRQHFQAAAELAMSKGLAKTLPMYELIDDFHHGILPWPKFFQLIRFLANELAFQFLLFAGFVTLLGLLL